MKPFNYDAKGLEVKVSDHREEIEFDIFWEGCGITFQLPDQQVEALLAWLLRRQTGGSERFKASSLPTSKRRLNPMQWP